MIIIWKWSGIENFSLTIAGLLSSQRKINFMKIPFKQKTFFNFLNCSTIQYLVLGEFIPENIPKISNQALRQKIYKDLHYPGYNSGD